MGSYVVAPNSPLTKDKPGSSTVALKVHGFESNCPGRESLPFAAWRSLSTNRQSFVLRGHPVDSREFSSAVVYD